MLVRDVDLWETLFTPPVKDDDWGTRSIQAMLSTVQAPIDVDGVEGDETRGAIRDFQSANGLAIDGVAGPSTRRALYRAYMDALCGPDLNLDKSNDFLARNQDSGGKGDFQGCSEFNPLRVFSTAEAEGFESSADHTERDKENAPNRRVVALLFAPGRRVNPSVWPCPGAKEGVTACKKRFFPDAELRRNPQDSRREFEDTKDTFACRFYQIISDDSPCERVKPVPLAMYRITVVDEFETPLSAISVTLAALNFEQTSATDSTGVVQFNGPAAGATAIVRNDKRLSDALAALVEKAPRDTLPPARPGFVAITPSKASKGVSLAASISQEIMLVARTDVVFDIPQGWEDLQPSEAALRKKAQDQEFPTKEHGIAARAISFPFSAEKIRRLVKHFSVASSRNRVFKAGAAAAHNEGYEELSKQHHVPGLHRPAAARQSPVNNCRSNFSVRFSEEPSGRRSGT